MSSVALHFASGAAFFTGVVCFLAGLMAVTFSARKWLPKIGRLLVLAGLFLIAASATPLPLWAWCVWGASFAAWATSRFMNATPRLRTVETVAFVSVVGITLGAISWELAYQLLPRLPPGHWSKLVVIGDSLSAADFTEGGDPWPALIAREHQLDVVNLAFSGAKAGSAEKHVAPGQVAGALVVLEIGGNDLLGETTPTDFEQDLGRLLQKVCRADNAVAMLELPLPPLYNRFGEIQRRLARRYQVVLVPKRYFAGVLAGPDSTVDGLHLSRVGHQKMAEMIFGVIDPLVTH